MRKRKLIFISGGARSGKSRFAEELTKSFDKDVTYIATFPKNDDSEMVERIKEHKRARPCDWKTLEIDNADNIISRINNIKNSVIIIECLTILVSNLLFELREKNEGSIKKETEEEILNKIQRLIEAINNSDNTFILVSNEVGQGIVPENEIARKYRDILGKVNQKIAKNADEFYVMFAGIPVEIKKLRKF